MPLPPSVAVFAHNEEARILDSLRSLQAASREPNSIPIKVLINGSKDRTEQIVRDWASTHPNVEPIVIPLGDKANAWNTYVFGPIAFDRNHYFLDGDCTLPPGTLDLLEAEFQLGTPLCVAPLPQNVSASLRQMLTERALPCGTMYGLSGEFLRRVVADKIRMPVGMIGDDNLLASMLHSNLDEHFENTDRARVRIVAAVGPIAHRPPKFSLEMIQLQRKRLRRYALRRVQMELLNRHVREEGLRSLPETAGELSRRWREPGLRWYLRYRGVETPYIWRALWKVYRESRRQLPRLAD